MGDWFPSSPGPSLPLNEEKMEQITSKDGTRIAFERSGQGKPLLLVHGTTADHHRWDSIAPRLEPYFTVYAMDRRGRGDSGDAPTYAIQREAADIAALVDVVAGAMDEAVAVLGHSYGALCSLEAALLTDKMSHLILYEPPVPMGRSLFPPELPERMDNLIDQGKLEDALVLFMREGPRMPEHELKAYRQLPMWRRRVQHVPTIPRELAIDNTYTFNGEKFSHMQVPTLLLLGGDSPPLFYEGTALIHAAIPHSQVVTMLGQQHIAMDLDPDLFIKQVLQFLPVHERSL